MFRRLMLVLIAAVLFIILGLYVYTDAMLKRPLLSEQQQFIIAPGQSLYKVAYQLHQLDSSFEPRVWVWYVRSFRPEAKDGKAIKQGHYQFDAGINLNQILEKLIAGDVKTFEITFVEGTRIEDAVNRIIATNQIKHSFNQYDQRQVAQIIAAEVDNPEGLVFSDTYKFPVGIEDTAVLKVAATRLNKELNKLWLERDQNLPIETPYEALILASIVEKETGLASERPLIAGVFIRRLQKNMRLQTDPTVIYGMGKRYQGNIRRKDLREKTPYNTYRINGLPPTPIALVGTEAIHAVLHPDQQSKALYFVARGDGSHYFSETLGEHNKAVRKYQIQKRRKNYQSAPKTP